VTDTERPKVISISDKLDEADEELREGLLEFISQLTVAIQEDRLEEIVLQWNESTDEYTDDGKKIMQSMIMHWNRSGSMDRSVGFAERLKQRLLMIAEGIIFGAE